MKHLTLMFSTRVNPVSAGIRFAAWSKWSHVGVVDYQKGEVLESVMIHGVRAIPIDEAIANADKYLLVRIRCKNPEKAIELFRSQIGKHYDYTALLGILIHRDWQNEGRWFCSEIITWCIETSGTRLFRPESMHRITQQDLYAQSYNMI